MQLLCLLPHVVFAYFLPVALFVFRAKKKVRNVDFIRLGEDHFVAGNSSSKQRERKVFSPSTGQAYAAITYLYDLTRTWKSGPTHGHQNGYLQQIYACYRREFLNQRIQCQQCALALLRICAGLSGSRYHRDCSATDLGLVALIVHLNYRNNVECRVARS